MGSKGVMDEIERIAVQVAESIMDGKGFSFRVPTRSSGNQKYVEELDRIVLGDKVCSNGHLPYIKVVLLFLRCNIWT